MTSMHQGYGTTSLKGYPLSHTSSAQYPSHTTTTSPSYGGSTSRTASSSASASATHSASNTSSASSTTSPPDSSPCGDLPEVIPTGLPRSDLPSCGQNFDKELDDLLGYLTLNASTFEDEISNFAPGISSITYDAFLVAYPEYADGTTGAAKVKRGRTVLQKRGWFDDVCSWVNNNIIQPVVEVAKEVYHAVADTVVAVVKTVEDFAKEAIDAMQEIAEALLPTFHPSVSLTIPVDIGPQEWQLDDSPWGDAYKIYEWKQGEGELNYGVNVDGLKKLLELDEILTIKINGVEQEPVPGVALYCVDCGIAGSLKTTGSATFTLLSGFSDLSLTIGGNIKASFQLGVDAFAEYEYEIASFRILTLGVPGFYIPEVITVGPMLTLDMDATINVEAQGQLLVGATYSLNKFSSTINFFDNSKSGSKNWNPVVTHIFNASGEATVTASVGLPIGVGIGIDILDSEWTEEVALTDRPALEAVATWSGSFVSNDTCVNSSDNCTQEDSGQMKDGECNGISWYVDFVNELGFDLFGTSYSLGEWHGPALSSGCIGSVPGGSSAATTTQSGPTSSPTDSSSGSSTCSIDDAVVNGGFDTIAADGSAPPWKVQDASWQVSMAFGPDEMALSQPNSAHLTFGYPGTIWLTQDITVCPDAEYTLTYNVRKLSGTGVCQMWSSVGQQQFETFTMINVVDGKNYFEQKGPYTFTITLPPVDDPGIDICFDPLEQDDCQHFPSGDPTIVPSADRSNATVPLSLIWNCFYGQDSVEDIRIEDVSVVPSDSFFRHKSKRDGGDSASATALATASITDTSTASDTTESTNDDEFRPASSIGPGTYTFPPLSSMLANATMTTAASTTNSIPSSSPGYITLRDTSSTVQLASADDGNLYLTAYPGTAPGTSFQSESLIVSTNDQGRYFHYYPATMDAYGVSRLRIAGAEGTPLTSQIITLVPVETSDGTVYTALDTEGNLFFLVWCTVYGKSKVFIAKDLNTGLQTLTGKEVQWVVTGGQVEACAPLMLTSDVQGS